MNKVLKYILIALVAILLIIQFVGGDLPENNDDITKDLIANGLAQGEAANILQTSCYDCHSNQTVYPWYSKVAPVSWLIAHDVEEGREELNFSEWTSFSEKRKLKKLEEIVEEVEEGEMPLPIYLVTHGNAKLSEDQMILLENWSKALESEILDKSEEEPPVSEEALSEAK